MSPRRLGGVEFASWTKFPPRVRGRLAGPELTRPPVPAKEGLFPRAHDAPVISK